MARKKINTRPVRILLSVFFVLIACAFVYFGESALIKAEKGLKEASGVVKSVDSGSVEASNEGQLVHVSGEAVTDMLLVDSVFGLKEKAIKLERIVEMYQWQEKEQKSTKGSDKYSYLTAWSEDIVYSGGFHRKQGHENPGKMPFSSLRQQASGVMVGAFTTPPELVSMMDNYTPISMDGRTPDSLPEDIMKKLVHYNGGYYIGNPSSQHVGDLRIRFQMISPAEVSLVAVQRGSSFEPYVAASGEEIFFIKPGIMSSDELFTSHHNKMKRISLGMKFAGWLFVFLALRLVISLPGKGEDDMVLVRTMARAGAWKISFFGAIGFICLLAGAISAGHDIRHAGQYIIAALLMFVVCASIIGWSKKTVSHAVDPKRVDAVHR